MSEEQDKDTKTEEPTEKRIRDAYRKGDVPASRETGNMVVVLALLGIAAFALPMQVDKLIGSLAVLIEDAGQVVVGNGQVGLNDLQDASSAALSGLVSAILPVFAILMAGALFGALIQGITVVSPERIRPKLSKISPKEGLKRLFSLRSFVEFAKNLVKVLAVGALAVWVTNRAVQDIWAGLGFIPEYLPSYIVAHAKQLLIWTACLLVPIAVLDILWRRYDWRRRQMMTLKEVRDELKETEGNPEVRARRARLRRERSQQRVAVAVPLANLVLTNPTHFAVALKYDPQTDIAPVCVAKGADNLAFRIRELAFEHDIPVIENKPLARLLFDVADLDEIVPAEQWEAVAEIVSFVMALKERGVTRKLPPGSGLLKRPV
ncbi:EscU/YscU/HrcU family type III secretion system export apparatus switch protein [Roseovarius indicus]|uniref:Flagellar biosynthesis protein n=1 Tax=Roseovarius indicus TaxID=540747 RepID=A0A0T5PBX7_9RHOB|nr:flagellar type III secretion system protein FlhB [Roseovarius indicus]KRS18589.1 flagellar biosynthesis protein [Roseovarius indicus]QEW25611.1 Flagellar biosynthetic protein FlhB [Roseovarius indicus]SFE01926.1 flagellar biosynthetic protein FlhB [Roseovarius indicus]